MKLCSKKGQMCPLEGLEGPMPPYGGGFAPIWLYIRRDKEQLEAQTNRHESLNLLRGCHGQPGKTHKVSYTVERRGMGSACAITAANLNAKQTSKAV